jgi:hypothetical protein
MVQCQCLTKCNQQCKNPAKSGSNFCTIHKTCNQSVDTSVKVSEKSHTQTDAIILLHISGTYPTEETQAKVYLCDHNKVNRKVRAILIDLYQEFIDYIDVDKGLQPLSEEYQKILHALLKSKEIDLTEELPYNPIIESQIAPSAGYDPAYDSDTGLYKKFNQSDDFVALDYHTPYDMHYYIDIQENITDEIDITVHEH